MHRLACETSSFHSNTVISAIPTAAFVKLSIPTVGSLPFFCTRCPEGACADSSLWQLALHVLSLEVSFMKHEAVAEARGHAACKSTDAAQLRTSMPGLTAEQNIISYSSCIAACDSCSRWQQALHLFMRSSKARLQPSIITYNSLANACAAAGEWQLALHFFWQSSEMKLLPTVVSYGTAINACEKAGLWWFACSLLHNSLAFRISTNTIMYDACVSTCGKGGQWRMANLHLSRMAMLQLERIDVSFNSAISACAKNSYWKPALGLLSVSAANGQSLWLNLPKLF